ncbi:hypothetical protein PA598K_02406 [Paenibacillus sp. 598K]|uniref:hypothetical protein n=1 Tax=Paenibacillus sp. 598K TaxID=1117987 RepID=UPI000FF9850A|nr:hypothetical protein [Paenibacillus sp. 598K]GBF74075.1 hypothetical protein PA598K_02406 [Paenibacillus sp. 598K]
MAGTTTIEDIVAVLEARRPLQPLQPRRIWDEALDRQIAELRIHDLGALAGETDKILSIQAGLHLWNDSLDRSHTLSQDLEHPTGSYWHGIMHRMEGDFSNSKYWMRQAGEHPAMLELHRESQQWLREHGQLESLAESEALRILFALRDGEAWDPYRFVDAVERLQYDSQPDDQVRQALEQLQYIEMRCLLRYCLAA